jgi:hypothetical protein
MAMKTWHRPVRFAVIALASFALLVTALPQVASAVGLGSLATRLGSASSCSSGSGVSGGSSACCGSSGGISSSSCTSGEGTVTGKVRVTGAPKGFVATFSGAGACPDTGTVDMLCANPIYALADGGSYSLSLASGTWVVDGFYEINAFGGAFLGTPTVVTVTPGGSAVRNFAVPYVAPASLSGTVKVTAVPSGTAIDSISALLCPADSPFTGGVAPVDCVSGYDGEMNPGSKSGTFELTGLPSQGGWIAYPGFCTLFGCVTNAKASKAVTLFPGKKSSVALSTPYIVPGNGLLDGKVVVTKAPPGFSPQVGVSACQVQSGGSSCEEFSTSSGSPFSLLLNAGQWVVSGLYFAAPFDNAIVGPSRTVTIEGGLTTKVTLAAPYRVLGTAAGTIGVTHVPSATKVTGYTVLACPVSTSTPPVFPSLSCVEEYSGSAGDIYGDAAAKRLGKSAPQASLSPVRAGTPIDTYSLPTLTPGRWILYPGYQTAFGTYQSPAGTTVTIAAAGTTTDHLTVRYQAPSAGLVSGKVSVTGAPLNGYSAGVRACNARPTSSSCPGEEDTYLQSTNGSYRLLLPPGTWWVSGFVDLYGSGPETTEVVSASHKTVVSDGSRSVESFTVAVG